MDTGVVHIRGHGFAHSHTNTCAHTQTCSRVPGAGAGPQAKLALYWYIAEHRTGLNRKTIFSLYLDSPAAMALHAPAV